MPTVRPRLPYALPAACLILLLSACSTPEPPEKAQAQPVRVISAGTASQDDSILATGLVGSREETRLGFKTGGVISSVQVDAGARVKRGQVLATLDRTELDAQASQAGASLAKARRDLARAERLLQQEVIAASEVQDARTQVTLAEAALATASFNRQHAVITAPGDGVVLQRLAEPREVAAPGAPVLIVSRDDLGWVLRVGLNDKAATRARVGDSAEIRLNAYPGQVIRATVRELGAASDPRTGTVTARLDLPALPGIRYIAGQVGEATISPRQSDGQHLTVPLGAILEGRGNNATLYVIGRDDKAEARQVSVGRIQGDHVEILSGLRPGERVVSEGAAWLNAGMPVRILR